MHTWEAHTTNLESAKEESSIFSHPGITVEKWYKIQLSEDALNALDNFIREIQWSLLDEGWIPPQSDFVISDISDATEDVLIEKGMKSKVKRFVKRVLKRKKWKLWERWLDKLQTTISKHSPEVYKLVDIHYMDWEWKNRAFIVPLIIRPGKTIGQILHSLNERANIHNSRKI